MADGGSAIKQFGGEVAQVVGEVAKDVKDSVGQAIEQGVQSVVGTQLTPQQIQQKQLEDQKKLAETRRKIDFYKQTDQAQKQVREENKQKEMQKLQNQQQEEQVVEIKKEQKKRQPINPATFYAGKAEFKRGVGG
ncbi:MAG: hypothetical protein PHV63_03800 [Candidatus Daviesbacteria bacterium]|nr:hypothetical protein [Candidatus Daviesbacteria bacterium]